MDDQDIAQTSADVIAWVSKKLDKEARLKDAQKRIVALRSELSPDSAEVTRKRLAKAMAKKQQILNERIPGFKPAFLIPN